MSKKVYLQIPEPCRENWDAMSPVEQGRFCNSCNKQVVDFSAMTDKEILKVLSQQSGSTCGRFVSDQLNKPLVAEVAPALKPYKFFLSAFIPAFLFAGKAVSQELLKGKVAVHRAPAPPPSLLTGAVIVMVPESITGSITLPNGEPAAGADVSIKGTKIATKADKYGRFSIMLPEGKPTATLQVSYNNYNTKELEVVKSNLKPLHIKLTAPERLIKGEIAIINDGRKGYNSVSTIARTKEVKGRVVNEDGEGLAGATVNCTATKQTAIADSEGHFSLHVSVDNPEADITTTFVGCEPVTQAINLAYNPANIIIEMKQAARLKDVVVVGYRNIECAVMMGGVSSVTRITKLDTANRIISKVFKNEMFKVFPNPANKASSINLTFKQAGNYALQVLDNAGRLYLAKEIKAEQGAPSSLLLPTNMANGTYYIKAVNSVTRKQFVDKILIQ